METFRVTDRQARALYWHVSQAFGNTGNHESATLVGREILRALSEEGIEVSFPKPEFYAAPEDSATGSRWDVIWRGRGVIARFTASDEPWNREQAEEMVNDLAKGHIEPPE